LKNWPMVKFGDVVKNANLVERDLETAGIERIVGLEHLAPENLHIRRWNTPENGTSFTRKFVPGQTLFGKRRAYQRKVALAEFEGICSGDILTFEPKDPKMLLPELLPFICQTDAFFDYALGTSAGSLSPRTSWKALKDFKFPLPPIEEQKRIAEILWAADEAIQRWKKIVDELEDLISKIREQHFSELQSIKTCSLDELTEVITKGESPKWQGYEYGDSGALFVTSENVLFGIYSPEPRKFIPLEFHEKLKRSQLNHGDVLVNIVGASIGRACVYEYGEEAANVNQAVAVIRCNQSVILPSYLLSYLLSPSNLRKLLGGSVNTARANISLTQLRKMKLPKTSLRMQKQFALNVKHLFENIACTQRHIKNLSFALKRFVEAEFAHV